MRDARAQRSKKEVESENMQTNDQKLSSRKCADPNQRLKKTENGKKEIQPFVFTLRRIVSIFSDFPDFSDFSKYLRVSTKPCN